MEKSNFVLNSVDRKGDGLKISCEGIDDQELAHFGGLDLHVKATKTMISNTNGMSFAEKAGDYIINEKVISLYLNEVGELIRSTSDEPDYLKGISNIELVKNFLEHLDDNPELVQIIEKDNWLIKKEDYEVRKEEDKIWDDIESDLDK